MAKFDYQITELVQSLDEDMQRIMNKIYAKGFDSFTIETYPNGNITMAVFNFFANGDLYSVDVDANGNLGEVRKS